MHFWNVCKEDLETVNLMSSSRYILRNSRLTFGCDQKKEKGNKGHMILHVLVQVNLMTAL